MRNIWVWKLGFMTDLHQSEGIQNRAVLVVSGLEKLGCGERLNDWGGLMRRRVLGSRGDCNSLWISVRLMHNRQKQSVFHVHGEEDRLGLNSSKGC